MIPFLRHLSATAVLVSIALLTACSPKYDWREVRAGNASMTLPGKPSEYTRPVLLGKLTTQMTMTATQVDGATFALGAAQLPDAASAQASLALMKEALVKNIDGKIIRERVVTQPYTYLEVEAKGMQQIYGKGQQVVLFGRFVARDKQIYQVIVAGEEKAGMREAAETFLTSFKPD